MEPWRKHFQGIYGNYIVWVFKYIGPHGEVGWHTKSWPNDNPIHDFWIVGSEYRSFGMNLFDPNIEQRHSALIGVILEDVNLEERQVILNAIDNWQSSDTF